MEWDCLKKVAKKHQANKNPPLVKLVYKQLLQILGKGEAWDAFVKMYFHGLKRMKFLLTPSFNANYFMLKGQKFQEMLPCENGISTSPFKLKKCRQSSISTHER